MKIYLRLTRHHALKLWSTPREINNRFVFTLEYWEAGLLFRKPGRRIVRYYGRAL